MLSTQKQIPPDEIKEIYAHFDAPIAALNCGSKCAPYNDRGVPFCCDTHHAVPTAYHEEWQFLKLNTDLWHVWEPLDQQEKARLQAETTDGMVLIECLGHHHCQRAFRSLTCRAFPFFPYLDSKREFLGLTYYWEYQDRCWVVSNLHVVSLEYRQQFLDTFDLLFARMPEERESYAHQSAQMRRVFTRRRRTIPLLHRDGLTYKVSPTSERMRHVEPKNLPKYGPYRIAAALPFPDELDNL